MSEPMTVAAAIDAYRGAIAALNAGARGQMWPGDPGPAAHEAARVRAIDALVAAGRRDVVADLRISDVLIGQLRGSGQGRPELKAQLRQAAARIQRARWGR